MASRLAADNVVDRGNLVTAYNQGVRMGAGDGPGLGFGKTQCHCFWTLPGPTTFVGLRAGNFERQAEAVQQFATVWRSRRKNQGL